MFKIARDLLSIGQGKFRLALFAVAVVTGFAGAAPASTLEVLQPAESFTRGFSRLNLAPAERYALIIGNAHYQNVEQLENPLNDVEAVAAAAANAGFKVFKAEDVNRQDMLDAISRFLVSVTPGSEAMIYYSGHGVELDGTNYLLPIDIRDLNPTQSFSIEDDSISLNSVLKRLESRQARVNIVMLDACRNNPFSAQATKALGDAAGLGSIEPAQGTIVLYSAAAGETALDRLGPNDTNPNGVFTRNLLPLMSTPGLEIRQLVQELKASVYSAALDGAGHQQRPSYYDGLIGQFYFMPQGIEVEPEPTPVPVAAPEPESTVAAIPEFALACKADARPDATLDEVILAGDLPEQISNCRRASKAYPADSTFTELVALATEQMATRQAMVEPSKVVLEAYLRQYPNGHYASGVRLQLETLFPPPPVVVEPPVTVVETPPVVEETPVEVATVEPVVVEAPVPQLTEEELTMQIQLQLARLSCGGGKADGKWGSKTTAAAKLFAKGAKIDVASNEGTMELLDALKLAQPGVCKVATYHPPSNGNSSSGSGTRVTTTSPPASKKCFVFNGETYCE